MDIVFIVGLVIALILIIYIIHWELTYKRNLKEISHIFKSGNCIIFGKKGKGKDLLTNAVINYRNELCYSNIQYNRELTIIKSIKDFSVEPNTFENMLEQNIVPVKKTLREETDMYISDGGIYLPSQYSNKLCQLYPSLPIYYATSRHLYNSNVHINTQYLGRVWDKLREQADGYFKLCGSHKSLFGKSLITEIIYYDTYKSAMSELKPYELSLFGGTEDRNKAKEYEAKNGTIKRYWIKQRIKNIQYDTRHFHKVFFGVRAPNSV